MDDDADTADDDGADNSSPDFRHRELKTIRIFFFKYFMYTCCVQGISNNYFQHPQFNNQGCPWWQQSQNKARSPKSYILNNPTPRGNL